MSSSLPPKPTTRRPRLQASSPSRATSASAPARRSLRAIGVDPADLGKAADAAAARPQLANTPPAATRDEILALYEAAL